jgi:glutamate-1-semialdehyde 2,1-aminomutase
MTEHDGSLGLRAAKVIPGGVNSGQRSIEGLDGLVIASTKGATFTDDHGQEYVDFHAAFGPPVLGHNDPDVDNAVIETVRKVDLMGVGVTELEVQLAEELVKSISSVEKVLLTVTGSEATFHALRVARAATGRRMIVKFQGCYHGWHDSIALNVISKPDAVGRRDPLSKGSLDAVLDNTVVLPFNDSLAAAQLFEAQGGDIAAVILELIPHNVGAILPQQDFLETLRSLCTQHGTVLIFDEVITGFRHALGGYQSIVGVSPDLTTLGKAMANGYPISALGGRADLMDLFSSRRGGSAFFAGTFNGHPAMVAAALATLRKLRDLPVHEHIFHLGELARTRLTGLYEELGIPVFVTGYGSVFVTYFLEPPVKDFRDLLRNDVDTFIGVRREAMKDGVFELPLNLKRSHCSYAHSEADIELLVSATRSAFQRIRPAVAIGR